MAKFIPIGTSESFYDNNSKLLRIPKSLINASSAKGKKNNEVNNDDLTNIKESDSFSRKHFQIEVKSTFKC